jgi:hypothetical protein
MAHPPAIRRHAADTPAFFGCRGEQPPQLILAPRDRLNYRSLDFLDGGEPLNDSLTGEPVP